LALYLSSVLDRTIPLIPQPLNLKGVSVCESGCETEKGITVKPEKSKLPVKRRGCEKLERLTRL
jgi:hypothetical protein